VIIPALVLVESSWSQRVERFSFCVTVCYVCALESTITFIALVRYWSVRWDYRLL